MQIRHQETFSISQSRCLCADLGHPSSAAARHRALLSVKENSAKHWPSVSRRASTPARPQGSSNDEFDTGHHPEIQASNAPERRQRTLVPKTKEVFCHHERTCALLTSRRPKHKLAKQVTHSEALQMPAQGGTTDCAAHVPQQLIPAAHSTTQIQTLTISQANSEL